MDLSSRLKTPKIKQKSLEHATRIPEGLWVKCSACGEILQKKNLQKNYYVCTQCFFHFRLNARDRIQLLVDKDSFKEIDAQLTAKDPLRFNDTKSYLTKIKESKELTGLNDAILTGTAKIDSVRLAIGVFEFKFMGGSMGTVVGEKICRVFEKAAKEKLPAVLIISSGGARMQEGILSLMQMAKTIASLENFRKTRRPFISVLTDPTTGGVAASFATLGDLILAEPGALIGFAGPRVIRQTIRQNLPEGFQRSEFLLRHGFVDQIVDRKELAGKVSRMIRLLTKTNKQNE